MIDYDEKSINTDEPAHDKTYNLTCLNSKDSDQPVHPLGVTRVLIYLSFDSPEAIEDTVMIRSAKTLIRLCGCVL